MKAKPPQKISLKFLTKGFAPEGGSTNSKLILAKPAKRTQSIVAGKKCDHKNKGRSMNKARRLLPNRPNRVAPLSLGHVVGLMLFSFRLLPSSPFLSCLSSLYVLPPARAKWFSVARAGRLGRGAPLETRGWRPKRHEASEKTKRGRCAERASTPGLHSAGRKWYRNRCVGLFFRIEPLAFVASNSRGCRSSARPTVVRVVMSAGAAGSGNRDAGEAPCSCCVCAVS